MLNALWSCSLVPYCTSDSWSGTRAESNGEVPFSFMGAAVVRQVVEDLLPLGLRNASLLLLAGSRWVHCQHYKGHRLLEVSICSAMCGLFQCWWNRSDGEPRSGSGPAQHSLRAVPYHSAGCFWFWLVSGPYSILKRWELSGTPRCYQEGDWAVAGKGAHPVSSSLPFRAMEVLLWVQGVPHPYVWVQQQ
jgi:hypothetical protein